MSDKKVRQMEMGHGAHFVGSADCLFRRATWLSNGFIVSTVGDYFPKHLNRREEVGHKRFFETYVFLSKAVPEDCGCYRPMSYAEIDAEHANTAKEAQQNHEEMVAKYKKIKNKRIEEVLE